MATATATLGRKTRERMQQREQRELLLVMIAAELVGAEEEAVCPKSTSASSKRNMVTWHPRCAQKPSSRLLINPPHKNNFLANNRNVSMHAAATCGARLDSYSRLCLLDTQVRTTSGLPRGTSPHQNKKAAAVNHSAPR
eukprot:362340-Chlamydomonas_euryale.AAC.2